MPLNPKVSFWSRCELIQRELVADLPPLNGRSSPKAGTFCRVSEGGGQLWLAVSDDADPANLNKWEFIGPSAGGVSLPDIRFIVARTGYGGGTLGDAVPSTTYTNADPAVAFNAAIAAASAYRAILQAFPEFAGLQAKVSIHLHPDRYNGTFTIPEGVTVHGLGASPSDTLVNRLNFSFPTGIDSGVRNVRLLGGANNIALASTNAGSTGLLYCQNVEVNTDKIVQLAHFGTAVMEDCVCEYMDWIAPQSSFLQSLRSQYVKVSLSGVAYRSVGDRVTGSVDGTPDVTLNGGAASLMRDTLIGIAGATKAVSVYLNGGATLNAYGISFFSNATVGGSLFDSNPDGLPCTLNVRSVSVIGGNNVLYGPISRLTVNAMSSHEAFTIAEIGDVVDQAGFVTVPYDGTPDIVEVTPSYMQVSPAADTFLLVPVPDATRMAPGRTMTYKNRSFPGTPDAGPFALVTSGQDIDNLTSSSAPVAVTSATHVIVPPGSQVTIYVRNNRTSFGIRGI